MAGQKGVGYEAIADELRARIASGDLPPGGTVPSENEIRAKYDVGRETAAKVLRVLREEGLISTSRGAPSKVREYRPVRRQANARLSETVWGSGQSMWGVDVRDERPEVVDLEVDRIEAPARVAEALGVPRGTAVVRRSRRYFLDGKPVLKAVSYLPADIADGTRIAEADTGEGGIYKRLEELGYKPTTFREEVRSRMPLKEERQALDLERGTPVLLVVRTASTSDGRVVEVNDMVLNAASYILDYVIPSA